MIIESGSGFFGKFVKGFTGVFSKNENSNLGHDLNNAKNTKDRINILNNFYSSNKNSKVTNVNGTPLMYNSKSVGELEIFIKNNGVDFKGKGKDTMFETEAKIFFTNLNDKCTQKGNIEFLKTLVDKSTNVSKYSNGIFDLQKDFQHNKEILDFVSVVKRKNPTLADLYYKENATDSKLLKVECGELFKDLNKGYITPENLNRINILIKGGAEIDPNFKESIIALEKNEQIIKDYSKFDKEFSLLKSVIENVKGAKTQEISTPNEQLAFSVKAAENISVQKRNDSSFESKKDLTPTIKQEENIYLHSELVDIDVNGIDLEEIKKTVAQHQQSIQPNKSLAH